MMYSTYLCDKIRQSSFTVFRTDLKKSKLVTPVTPLTPGSQADDKIVFVMPENTKEMPEIGVYWHDFVD